MYLAIIGPSGGGKDTQASFIEEKFGVKHFSIGQLFRNMKGRDDAMAKKVLKIISSGNLVPDEITVAVMKDYIESECEDGFVVTGFPRTLQQFKMLTAELEDLDIEWTKIIHLELSDEESLDRMRKQAEDAIKAGKPRTDSSEELMMNRLNFYHENIDPILAECREMGILMNVNAHPSIPEIKQEILSKLEKLV
jgi:adenylate kinase